MGAPAELSTLPRRRRWVNTITHRVVAVGGGAVIAAIVLIFFYLLWVVAPIFSPATIRTGEVFSLGAGDPVFLEVNESGELAFRISTSGDLAFFELDHGQVVNRTSLGRPITKVQRVFGQASMYAAVDVDNQLALFEASYPISFTEAGRVISSRFESVFGEDWLELGDAGSYDVHFQDFTLTLASLSGAHLEIRQFRDAEPGYSLEFPRVVTVDLDQPYDRVLFGPRGSQLYLLGNNGGVEILDLRRLSAPTQIYRGRLVPQDTGLAALEPLLGRYSLLVADTDGGVSQWFGVRDEFGQTFEQVRRFQLNANARWLVPEQRRKGFVAIDETGGLNLLYTTSGRILARTALRERAISVATISPRAKLFLTATADGRVDVYHLENEHPEISWSALWSQVWYEGYPEPVYSWQSSSADNDFEPKFSLTPLLFGTIKAAFYAMLFAVPTAIMGALYTAYFMAPVMRRIVKPGIEIMAALPTVILGFLAGLWLAPLIEANLAAVLAVPIILPAAICAVSFGWQHLPDALTRRLDGWHGLFAVPLIVAIVAAAFASGPLLENQLFGGDIQAWLLHRLGLGYDQRNSLIVGLAMGLAVIPSIFSIAEDAIYGVPTHLINGSLALGATRWQTLTRVVILTASPGIFSAIMIGLGRAVGETMIVLMATGNTPIMDWNLFQGMRTFAANIAVELPEAEVAGTHYRILFLAALVLFIITFLFNTVAEVVRQQLRERYGNL